MTPVATSSPRYVLSYESQLAKSGLRNRPPEMLPSCWAPSSTGLFGYSLDSDPQARRRQSYRLAMLDPVEIATRILGHDYWDTQAAILRATFQPSARVAVKGCHASSKTFAAADAVLVTLRPRR